MIKRPSKIINGFGFLKDKNVIFIDLYTEKFVTYDGKVFEEFIKENNVDEDCILLSNREDDVVTPLLKFDLVNHKTKERIKAHLRPHEELITLCYKICIQLFKSLEEHEELTHELTGTGDLA